MSPESFDVLARSRRRFRIVSILDGAHRAGLTPLPLLNLHAIAFFADALAPVWGIRILDAQLLRRSEGPMSPEFQADVDRLVGKGVVQPCSVRHVLDEDGRWRLDAHYQLNYGFGLAILETASAFENQARQLRFVHEVVHAVSALGEDAIDLATTSDAAYGSDFVDVGGIVDIASNGKTNESARTASRIGDLMMPEVALSSAEMVHLYVRELHKRMGLVA
jgi:hypothetical protein